MGHLTGAQTERRINSVEVVSDDSQRVLKFRVDDKGVATIALRDATEIEWDVKTFAVLDKADASVVATVLNGGAMSNYINAANVAIEGLPSAPHSLPRPESPEPDAQGDCTPLDIERAKAANLKEQREIIALEMERDHALDRHTTADVPGCPACDRKGYRGQLRDDPGLTDLEARGQTMPGDDDLDDIPF